MKKDNKTIINKIIPDSYPVNQNFSGAGSAYPHNILINGKEMKPGPINNILSRVYKHTLQILNNDNNKQIIFSVFLNTETPPEKTQLLGNNELLKGFGVLGALVENNAPKYCGISSDSTNFVIGDSATPSTGVPDNCIIVSDSVIDLLDVDKTINN